MIIALVLIALPFPLAAQSPGNGIRAIESKLLDVPSAAYKLVASRNGRGYEFRNSSALPIVQMQLGCAKKKGDTVKILTVRPSEDIDLAPAQFRFWHTNHGFFPGEACKKGKLTIVEVKFADGTQWKLKA
ncbi:MAG: hypothetical protein ACR2H4_07755 [Pyrinomonadaceae bacterium]